MSPEKPGAQTVSLVTSSLRPVVVRLADVRKSYRRGGNTEEVLRGVNLSVREGQLVYLVGPSGCGKTTLLSIIGCILQPDAGKVELFGRDVTTLDEKQRSDLRRTCVGFVFQRFHLLRGLTAEENVMLPLVLAGASQEVARRKARRLLEIVGLGGRGDQDPRDMSVGMCQRVAIARALACDPPLILADEPTASLDAVSGPAVMQLLRDLTRSSARTVIVVTHDTRILDFADQIYELNLGTVRPWNQAS